MVKQVLYAIRSHAKLTDPDADGHEHIDALYWRDGGWTRDPARASLFETLEVANNRCGTEPELVRSADVVALVFDVDPR
jgi:hypothetical protein